ncbi:MAG: molybdopterin molybdotransferase MoeA [Desulfobacterales bacterium]|nr:molybdopterin molybdotransferase MoeA [Desulfobacterales bacterium]MDD4072547.1 molybdopterin molybdotransferase MoeA [Desulfobacterales bacterium]MDD4393816.1 molybdopterin molybdotransferase MoeA [Desulfobacterales bacterium]
MDNMKLNHVLSSKQIPADAVQAFILSLIQPVSAEHVPVDRCLNRILARDIVPRANIPACPLSAMDGFAVVSEGLMTASKRQPVIVKVIDNIRAGDVPGKSIGPGTAARIMTGAALPGGADSVVPFENTSERLYTEGLGPDEIAVFKPVAVHENVRREGSDIEYGKVVLAQGTQLRPQDMGMLVSVGKTSVPVYRIPRVAVLPTGNEVMEAETPLSFGKIWSSNPYVISGLVQRYGAEPLRLGIARDSKKLLTFKINQALALNVDLVLTCAGTSNGDFDMIQETFQTMCHEKFWKAEIKPGKTMAFGMIDGVCVMGLPGNPGALIIAFELFARGVILKLAGQNHWDKVLIKATLKHDFYDKQRAHLIPAVLSLCDGYPEVEALGHAVNDQRRPEKLSTLVQTNAFLDVPRDVTFISAGSRVNVWPLD